VAVSRRAVAQLHAQWAEEGTREAAELASRRHVPARTTRLTDDTATRRTRVLAAWLQDHSIYGTGEQ
jgi:hypothetical protein